MAQGKEIRGISLDNGFRACNFLANACHEIISGGTTAMGGVMCASISDIALPLLMCCILSEYSSPLCLGEVALYLLYTYKENKDQRLRETK